MGNKKAKSETQSEKTSPTTPTAPHSAVTPSTASTAVPCPHSDGTVPICWDCVETGHPGTRAAAAAAALVSPLSEKKRKRSKASIFSKLSGSGTSNSSSSHHSALQVHPPEPGKEVIVADYQHLSQPGLEVLAGPRAVDPQSKAYYKNNNSTNTTKKRTNTEDWDAESTTVRDHASSKSRGRILGMSRKRFWYSAFLIGLLVVVITVGVVVAMQQTGKFAKNTSAQSNSGSGTTPTSSAGPSAAPSTTSTPGGGTGPITCPSANNSTYTLPDGDGSVKFRIGCGFSRDGGDLQSLTTGTFLACLQACAGRTGCAGVSWINDGDAGSANNYCYTKLAMDGKARNNVFAQSAEIVTA
ncbi:hypothetical protein PG994_003241 [Apiospora phragmitis]|uniref:Apple domain-containing protein n=1 Tax=Apiospora phragmitis TaxID=2905665 RepID=A0ABR1VXK7_9PEZI